MKAGISNPDIALSAGVWEANRFLTKSDGVTILKLSIIFDQDHVTPRSPGLIIAESVLRIHRHKILDTDPNRQAFFLEFVKSLSISESGSTWYPRIGAGVNQASAGSGATPASCRLRQILTAVSEIAQPMSACYSTDKGPGYG